MNNFPDLKDYKLQKKKDLLDQWPIKGMIMGIRNNGSYDIEGRVYCSLEEKEEIIKGFVYWDDFRIKRIKK